MYVRCDFRLCVFNVESPIYFIYAHMSQASLRQEIYKFLENGTLNLV